MGAVTCFLEINIDHWQKAAVQLFSGTPPRGCFLRSNLCEIVPLLLQVNESKFSLRSE